MAYTPRGSRLPLQSTTHFQTASAPLSARSGAAFVGLPPEKRIPQRRPIDTAAQALMAATIKDSSKGLAGAAAAKTSTPRRVRALEPHAPRFGTEPSGLGAAGEHVDRKSSVRTFDNCPMMQSTVDQVVFGRDMDLSGDTKFDDDFIQMYDGLAGLPSWYRKRD
eukprot:TRINITY_DN22209_c0_g1_i1.p1 TRINITY_DN22209_c0_g1~~TRINITY_DN22209_c0_g1_i1.p1  ORF type:complete len:164 (-),score=31.52 TRINITY_DN22209_c0_g1_i1:111-602(-)